MTGNDFDIDALRELDSMLFQNDFDDKTLKRILPFKIKMVRKMVEVRIGKIKLIYGFIFFRKVRI